MLLVKVATAEMYKEIINLSRYGPRAEVAIECYISNAAVTPTIYYLIMISYSEVFVTQ